MACDRVLLAQDSTIECTAISWLHIIREHPMLLAGYADLFESDKGVKRSGRKWLETLRHKVAWLRRLMIAFSSAEQSWQYHTELPDQSDILFVSHLVNASHAGQASDFYYGELPSELTAKGFSTAIALINHTGHPGGPLAAKWKECRVPRVIFSRSLDLPGEFSVRRRLKTESLRLEEAQ